MEKQNKKISKVLVLLMAVMMVFTMMPSMAFAAGNGNDVGLSEAENENVTVYVTISNQGAIPLGRDGTTGMIQVPISVPKTATEVDVLKKAHELYSENGTGDYTEKSGWFSKFWGVETSNIGYFRNGAMVMYPTTVSSGDYIEGMVYGDYTKEKYTTFQTHEVTASAFSAIRMQLLGNVILSSDFKSGMMMGGTADQPITNTKILVGDSKSCNIPYDDSKSYRTDGNGVVYLSFEDPGVYYIAPDTAASKNIPGTCKITVTEAESEENRIATVNADKEALGFDQIKGSNTDAEAIVDNLYLTKSGNSGKTLISWTSNDPAVISNEGTVTRPLFESGDKNVVLTANITYGDGVTATKKITVTVSKLPSSEEVLNDVASKLPERLTPQEWNDEDTAKKDTNIITLLQEKVNEINSAVTVAKICKPSEAQTQIAADGTITYGTKRVSNKDVTFTLQLGEKSITHTLKVTVAAKAATKEEALKAEWLTFDTIKVDNAAKDQIKKNLSLPKEDDEGYYTEITWSSSNSEVISVDNAAVNGKYAAKVTRPGVGEADAKVTLTAKIEGGAYWAYGMAPHGPMPDPAYGIVTFDLTVLAVTEEEKNEAQQLVNEAINLFSLDDITIRGTSEKAELSALTYHINNIPYNMNYVKNAEGYDEKFAVINVKWTSENSGIGEITSGANITRTDTDQSGDILLTLSYNGAEASKRFPTTVKAWTQADAENENQILEAVKTALTFDQIKGENTTDLAVQSQMTAYQSAVVSESNVQFGTSKAYHKNGANITWSSDNPAIIKVNGSKMTVTLPETNTPVNLTATIKSIKFNGMKNVSTLTKTITVTVSGSTETKNAKVSQLMENIAKTYVNQTSDWHVMDMGAYVNLNPSTQYKTSAEAKQTYINNAISYLAGTSLSDTEIDKRILALTAIGGDITQLYRVNNNTPISAITLLNGAAQSTSVWSAPYTLAAYNQGNYAGTESYETALADALVAAQEDDGSWNDYGTIDTTANAIAGLAFYADRAKVKTAIEKGVNYLASQQKASGAYDGGYGENANSTAMVIIGLAAAGVNPDTDQRFIKNGNSALDGLLSFAIDNNTGFWNGNDKTTVNDYATEQSFRALIAAAQVMQTGKAYNVYDFSQNPVTAVRATGAGAPTPTPTEPTGENITVTFTIKADTGYWLNSSRITIKETGATVYHAFVKACEAAGITYVGAENGYVSSMTKAGKTLAAFTNGQNSGWMYKVNGTLPDVGLTSCSIKNGDDIVWFYTNDWTTVPGAMDFMHGENSSVTTSGASGSAITTAPTDVKVSEKTNADGTKETVAAVKVDSKHHDEIIKQAAENKSAEIVLEVSQTDSKGADNVQLMLDVVFVKNVADKTNADLTVNTENGKVTLNREALKTVLGAAKGTTLTLEVSKVAKPTEAQKKAAGANAYLFKLIVKSGGKSISDFNKGSAQVRLALPSALLDKKTAAIHIAEDGTIEQFAGKVLTIGGKKYYEFTTPHFSTFALVDADEAGLDVVDEQTVDAKALTAKLTPIARSAKTAKKNVKVKLSLDKQDKEILNQLADAGYTVRYRFYRSTKKAAGYKAAVTKKTMTYTNTTGKQGTKYFYKVQIRVYDKNGKLEAKTALKQCRYACRSWTK